jgi:hypothetical protein
MTVSSQIFLKLYKAGCLKYFLKSLALFQDVFFLCLCFAIMLGSLGFLFGIFEKHSLLSPAP